MNGSLALYFRPGTPDDVVQAEAENVLRLISEGMKTDKFRTIAIPFSVFASRTSIGNKPSQDDEDGEEPTVTGSSDGDDGAPPDAAPPPPVLEDIGSGAGGIFVPKPGVASSTKEPGTASSTEGGGDGNGGDGSSSSALYAGIGAGVAVLALVVVLALLLRRRKRNALARKYSLREVGNNARHLEDSPEITTDGVVIVDKSKSHRKTSSHNFSDGTYGETTIPNEMSGSFDDDGGYQEVVELGLTEEAAAATAAIAEAAAASAAAGGNINNTVNNNMTRSRTLSNDNSAYYTATSVEKTRSNDRSAGGTSNGTSTVGANNRGSRSVGSTSNNQGYPLEDDDASTGSEESGVTIELHPVNSTVSDITWAGPKNMQNASAAGNILNRFPPYKSLYSPNTDGVIAEEEDYDDNDEDDLVSPRKGSGSGSGGSHGGSRTSGGSTEFGTPRPLPKRRM